MRRLLLVMLACAAMGAARAEAPAILVMGDSLSAAYGIPLEQGWAQLLQQRLERQGYPHRVINGSVSGETTSGGLARLPVVLERHRPVVVLIELGGNDGLRGLPLAELRANLREMARLSRAAGARPVLFEMRIPPNYGAAYAEGFFRSFGEVAADQGAALVPFFLEPIVSDPGGFQDDGIHPTVEAQPLLLDRVWPVLEPLLKQPPRATFPASAAPTFSPERWRQGIMGLPRSVARRTAAWAFGQPEDAALMPCAAPFGLRSGCA